MKKVFLFISALPLFLFFNVNAQDVLQAAGGANITIEKNANVYVGGNMVLDNNTSLYNNGTVLLAKKGKAGADFTDNTATAYNYGAGKFIFWGDGLQSIKTNNQFGVIEVDNKGLNLFSNISADNWSLKNGTVNTGSFYAVAIAPGYSGFKTDGNNTRFSNSWVNGNVRQYISATQTDYYILPVGDASGVKTCELNNLSGNPLTGIKYIDFSFARLQGSNNGLKITENGMNYGSINTGGVWSINPDAMPTSGSFDLKLSIADFSGLTDNRFALLNSQGMNETGWKVPAGSVLPVEGSYGRTVGGGFARRNNISTFNRFAVANMEATSPDVASFYKVYPDPVTANEFFIQLSNYTLKGFKMFAADGKEVNVNSIIQKNGQVKVSLPASFAKGHYVVQLNTDKGFKSCKIIVQ